MCLGLKNNKDYVAEMIRYNNIDICGLQECEVEKDYPLNVLSIKGYNIETETNINKARVCLYINQTLNYSRRKDLEGEKTCTWL